MVPRLNFGLAFALSVTLSAPVARAADYPCTFGGFSPVNDGTGKISPEAAIFMLLVPIGGLYRDSLASTPKVNVRLRVVDTAGKPVPSARAAALIFEIDRYLGVTKGPEATLSLPEGEYDFNALVPDRPMRWGTVHRTLKKGAAQTVEIKLDQTSAVGAAGSVPAKIVGGSQITVGWTGERPPGAHVFVFKTKDGKREIVGETDVGGGSGDFTIEAPFATGTYDTALSICAPDYTLGRWTLNVTAPKVTLSAPPTAPGGSEITVSINQPHVSEESLSFERPDGDNVQNTSDGERVDATTFKIKTPLGRGDYRLVYSVASERVAQLPIKIGAAQISLKAPPSVRFAERFPVTLEGADDKGVEIEVWSTGSKPVKAAEGLDLDDVRILGAPGPYEIRLVERALNAQKVLARTTIQLLDGPIIAEAPKTAAKGEEIRIKPVYAVKMDDILIVKRGSQTTDGYLKSASFERDGYVTIDTPDKPGAYDIIYAVSNPAGFGNKIIARIPLDIH